MAWTERDIQSIFSKKDFARGKEYYQYGKVHDLKIRGQPGSEEIACVVNGTKPYNVYVSFDGSIVKIRCSCDQFAQKRVCKHVAAAMIAFVKNEKASYPLSSDTAVNRLLKSYLEDAQNTDLREEKARVVPKIYYNASRAGNYPSFSLQVGFDRLYVVKDIRAFADNIANRRTVAYGKNLTLYHALEQFDDLSQQLIAVIMDQFMEFRVSSRSSSYFTDLSYGLWERNGQKNRIVLTGSSFDAWFNILNSQTIERADTDSMCRFRDGSPEISVTLHRRNRAAEIEVNSNEQWQYFGSNYNLYAINSDELLHCPETFRRKIWSLIDTGASKHRIAFADLPAFCSCVLPEIRDIADVRDPDNLMDEYLPDECVPYYYFDMEDGVLSARLAFRYGDTSFDFGSDRVPASIKRDMLAESAAQRLMDRYFEHENGNKYYLAGDDAVYSFLTDNIEHFHESGEVFITDRLRAQRVQVSSAGVGISVSGGLIDLNVDTGGFPPEELEDLYQSLLRKRRYYKLRDGRYLTLNGSECETLAEMSHMLQLKPDDLKKGSVKLPAFRGLYLDSLLKGSESLSVHRDRQFRDMIRNFKSLSESDYTLPETLENTLRPYQRVGFQWLKTLESYGFGGILADEMGLGKTIQVIAFLMTAKREKTGMASLVVCPASLILNWSDECARFAPSLKVKLIMGTATERRKLIAESDDSDVWVTSYELLRSDVEKYSEFRFYSCILDEGQHIKNQSTQVSKAVKRIDCQQRFVLTGTPVENRLSELWNLFDFLMPGYLFSHNGFVDKLEKPIIRSDDKGAMEQLKRLVQPFVLRRMKADVLKELPPKIEHVRKIALSEEERKVYLAASLDMKRKLESGEPGKLAILAALTQLRQICCAPELCFENYQGPDSKLEAVLELCGGMVENGHQILLFSQFTSMLDIIRPRLDALNISNYTLQGSTSKEKRAQLVRDFNAGGASVFLISLKAGGTGLNLTAADVVIHYDPWWNMAVQNQATDRAHRIGQMANVQVYKLIAKNTIEEKIIELQEKKASLMDAVSGDLDAGIMNMSQEDLLALFD